MCSKYYNNDIGKLLKNKDIAGKVIDLLMYVQYMLERKLHIKLELVKIDLKRNDVSSHFIHEDEYDNKNIINDDNISHDKMNNNEDEGDNLTHEGDVIHEMSKSKDKGDNENDIDDDRNNNTTRNENQMNDNQFSNDEINEYIDVNDVTDSENNQNMMNSNSDDLNLNNRRDRRNDNAFEGNSKIQIFSRKIFMITSKHLYNEPINILNENQHVKHQLPIWHTMNKKYRIFGGYYFTEKREIS